MQPEGRSTYVRLRSRSRDSPEWLAFVIMHTDGPSGKNTSHTRSLSLRSALAIAVLGAAIAIGATLLVLRNQYATATEAALAAVALVAFGFTTYGLLQAVLAFIDTAGERRRHEREVTERRRGDRARQSRQG